MNRREWKRPSVGVTDMEKAAQWLAGSDTGCSSKTMVLIALGAETGSWSTPCDLDDFGRCRRMLKELPFVRQHFPAILKLAPEYTLLFREWDNLVRLFDQDLLTSDQVDKLASAGLRFSEPEEPYE